MRRTSETDSKSTLSQSHSWIIQLLSCSVKLPPSSSSSSSSSCLLTGCDRGLARSSGTSFTLINVSSSCEHIYSFMLLCLSSLYYIHSSSAYQSPPHPPPSGSQLTISPAPLSRVHSGIQDNNSHTLYVLALLLHVLSPTSAKNIFSVYQKETLNIKLLKQCQK